MALAAYVKEFELGRKPILINQVTGLYIHKFMDWLSDNQGITNKTFNNYRGLLSGVFTYFIGLELIARNPVKGLPVRKVLRGGKHRPFTLAEIRKIKEVAIENGDEWFVLFINFCFYTLARPHKELRLLKISDIKSKTIWISPENMKTDKGRMAEIAPPLESLINHYNLRSYPPNYYIFSGNGRPGPTPCCDTYFYRRQVKYLKQIGLDGKGHDLYSYKHSGNIYYSEAGLQPIDLMRMNGHSNPMQFMAYLSDIGAITPLSEKLKNIQAI